MRRSILLLLVAASACSGGGGGDTPLPPQNYTLAYYNNPANPRPSESEYISVDNLVIMAVDDYDETKTGSAGNLFVQDMNLDPQPYSGITVYNPGFIPPNLHVFIGDVVDVRSPYTEFTGPSSSPFKNGATLPELSGATVKFRFESPALPAPKVIRPDELYDYESGRKWLGMYVEIQNVSLWEDMTDDGKGRFSARLLLDDMAGRQAGSLPKLTNGLYPIQDIQTGFKQGSKFTLRGIVEFFYSFSINPRSADDISAGS